MSAPITLIIADEDRDFSIRLAEWILVHPETGFQSVFIENSAPEPIDTNGLFSIVLFSGERYERMFLKKGIKAICMDENGTHTSSDKRNAQSTVVYKKIDGVSFPSIEKYQPIPRLLQEVYAIAIESGWIGKSSLKNEHVGVSLIIHLSDAVHFHPVAPVLAMIYAKNAKTLFLELNPAGHTGFWFPHDHGDDLSRILFWIRNKTKDWVTRMSQCVFKDPISDVFIIRESDIPEDAASTQADECSQIVQATEYLDFKEMIIDSGVGLHKRNLSLLSIANHVIFVCGMDAADDRQAKLAIDSLKDLSLSIKENQNHTYTWLFIESSNLKIGAGAISSYPIPAGHRIYQLPNAYLNGFPLTGWSTNSNFLSTMVSLFHQDVEKQ